jgi:hypothetical protein
VVTRQKARQRQRKSERTAAGVVRVNVAALAPNNSYGAPGFVQLGHYEDEPFTCNKVPSSCAGVRGAQLNR